jgi:hypothetical protein
MCVLQANQIIAAVFRRSKDDPITVAREQLNRSN